VKEIFFLSIAGVLVLSLETTSLVFLASGTYKPDLFLVLVIWGSLRLPFIAGVGLAFVGGMCVDLLSGSPAGLFAVTYCSIFVVCGYLNTVFQIDTLGGRAVTTFGAAMASAGIVFLARALTGPADLGWNTLEWVLLKSSFTSLSSLVLFPSMDQARMVYSKLVGMR
jgi:rod shape-determining protein MreD